MNVTFTDDSWQEYLDWQTTDKKVLKKINALIKDIKKDPFGGIGKPEALKYELSGCWSRRITNEHRVVYEVSSCCVVIISCKYHY
jgi:toxin YoeB